MVFLCSLSFASMYQSVSASDLCLKTFRTPFLHEALFVHASCLKEACPEPSTYSYEKDLDFCITCESLKRGVIQQQTQLATQQTQPIDEEEDDENVRDRPLERAGAAPPGAPRPLQPPAPKKAGRKSKGGVPLTIPAKKVQLTVFGRVADLLSGWNEKGEGDGVPKGVSAERGDW